ncbi:MAG: adenylyl-sulfate kinase [Synergistaceae bacterium]|jgi:bifunctional enzyme CysN/CysC|nr:adenylyl-sulfate kinase [Synergistaceae bacterium]
MPFAEEASIKRDSQGTAPLERGLGQSPKSINKTQLRFLTCGSVDDGKSTLIGRLLYDSGCLFEDQLSALQRESLKKNADGELDFSLLMDGLLAEREQGITIDVAYRYFETKSRKFIVADSPGHEQYTRNMVTGASNSEAAVVLTDARNGVLPQTVRHTYIAALLGIRRIVLAVNKMDLAGWSKDVFDEISKDYADVIQRIKKMERGGGEIFVTCIPLSALKGNNVFVRGDDTPWYDGPTLAEYLETVEPSSGESEKEPKRELHPFRMPVQWVNRPDANFRGYCGTVAEGAIRAGDEVVILPSGQKNTVESIIVGGEKRHEAGKGEAGTLSVTKETDISRGDFLSDASAVPDVTDHFRATVVWMSENKLLPGREYLLKISNRTVLATVTEMRGKINIETFLAAPMEPAQNLAINEIGICNVKTGTPIVCESYSKSRGLGGFIFIDRVTNETVGAGMVQYSLRRAANVTWQSFEITKEARARLMGQTPRVLWFTGLSGSGKSTLANWVDKKLFSMGLHSCVLDGDNVRHGLNKNLGFTEEDRIENIRRTAEVAKLMLDAGLIVLVAFISPFRKDRESARSLFAPGEFIEVFVDTPLAVCEGRDPKGLYKKARAGEIPNFTGINAPYERPEHPELVVNGNVSAEEEAERIVNFLGDWLIDMGLTT